MTPHKSYRIWFSNRNGSTLLCRALEATGIAGRPGEHFYVHGKPLLEHYQVSNYEDFKNKLWKVGTSDNGVFGLKDTAVTDHYNKLFQTILDLRGIEYSQALDHELIWADLFPNCKHIMITRRNKIRQAVSWWKAINDHTWHLEKGQSHENDADFYDKHYVFDALMHLFKETVLRECAIQDYFSKNNIVPLTIVYEDFVADYTNTIKRVVDYLEIPYKKLEIPAMPLNRTSSHKSEAWVQRFRNELQEGYEQRIW